MHYKCYGDYFYLFNKYEYGGYKVFAKIKIIDKYYIKTLDNSALYMFIYFE